MRILMALFATLALAACGGGSGDSQGERGTGALHVQARALATGSGPTEGEVASIVVTATDTGAVDHQFELVFDASNNVWEGTSPRLYTGDYVVGAEAFAADGTTILFASTPETVAVQHNQTVTLVLVMNQQTTPTEHQTPYISSVVLDRTSVEQGDDIQIRVNAAGGVGSYQLTGRHALSAANPGLFTGAGAMTDGTGELTWTAPYFAGPAWFVVSVTDAEGNVAELGITVLVGSDYGWLDASVRFNLAPSVNVTTRSLNDGDAATFYFWMDVTDADNPGGTIDYAWTASCNANWFTTGYATPSGTVTAGTNDVVFKADVVGTDREIGDCAFTLTATDGDGASSTLVLTVPTLEAPVDTLSDVVFEEAFGTDGDFIAASGGVFKWRRTDAAGARNITAPIAYFLHRAGKTAVAELGFEDMYARTNADPTVHANFNSMDLGVMLYAYEATGDVKFLNLATAMFPAWMAKYQYGTHNNPRETLWGYDSYNLLFGAFMADKYDLPGAETYLAGFTVWYEGEFAAAIAGASYHTIWTNLIADEFEIGARDDAYQLDVAGPDASVQYVAYAVLSGSVDPAAAAAYLFQKLDAEETSQPVAEGLAALVALGL